MQKELVENKIILLKIEDVMNITGWSEATTRRLFAYDKEFPAIKIGKCYQIEADAFKDYLKKRKVNE